jgi:lipopolysaccharide export system permease protein
MIKILDKYLIKQFIGPFIVSFFIALFVLLLQTIWVYIDDIMGKGAGILFISEMIFYLSVNFIAMALVIGILLAAVMTVGNLAEQYELSSMKSAGISLFRVMLPLLLFCTGMMFLSFACSDILMPWAKLKYNARLYDIRRQKPALAIEEGVFTENFAGYTIRIGKKDKDGTGIKDVMIYQQAQNGSVSELLAEKGIMTSSDDKLYMIMNLENGRRYENLNSNGSHRFAFLRTSFKQWNKIFASDELESTDEKLFGNSPATKSSKQLRADIDSFYRDIDRRKTDFSKGLDDTYEFIKISKKDSAVTVNINQSQESKRISISQDPVKQTGLDNLKAVGNFSNTILGYQRGDVLGKAKASTTTIIQQAESSFNSIDKIRLTQTKHIAELMSKFVYASLCVVFLFIGAPMGAIVRKGGFGFPILIAIGFFILFIFLLIMCRKLGEQGIFDPYLCVWYPVFILLALGSYLTYRAMRDEKAFNFDKFSIFLGKIKSRFRKK